MLRDKLLFLFFRKITNYRNIGLNDASLLVSKNTTLAYFYEILKICNDSRIMRIIINYAFGWPLKFAVEIDQEIEEKSF